MELRSVERALRKHAVEMSISGQIRCNVHDCLK